MVVLHKGLPVTGRVLDRDGRPIAGASVRLGDPFRQPTALVTNVKTDTEGRFRIGNTPMKDALLVQAAGYAPELASVKVRRISRRSSSASARAARSRDGSSTTEAGRSRRHRRRVRMEGAPDPGLEIRHGSGRPFPLE